MRRLLIALLIAVGTFVPSVAHASASDSSKAIVIYLDSQTLVAYDDGNVVLSTPVTTGRAGLRTPVGITDVFARHSPYLFISPWGINSRYWSSWVNWAMEFRDSGYYIHDAPWEPWWAFGAGSEDGPYASHGCVHTPYYAMRFLWYWTPSARRWSSPGQRR